MIQPTSWLDVLFYVTFLIPNLLFQLSVRELFLLCGLAIPYALFVLPFQLLYDRSTTRNEWTFFQNLVLRIVRFAFGNLSPRLGQVFFSEDQAWPFIRFRTDGASSQWKQKVSTNGFEGYWIRDPWIHTPPRTVIFYLHGGGFTMGSTAFYFEFLMNVVQAIPGHRARVFSLDYSLVPNSIFPTQLEQIIRAYEYLLTSTSPEDIILAGDSAGASLHLSLLLHIVRPCPDIRSSSLSTSLPIPRALILISPWCHIDTQHETTCRSTRAIDEDYLETDMLNQYARLYTGASQPRDPPPLIFPLEFWWQAAKRLGRQVVEFEYTSKWISAVKSSIEESSFDSRESTRHADLCKSPYRNPFAALDHPAWLADALPFDTLVIYGGKEFMAGDIKTFAAGLEKVSRGKVEIKTCWKLGWHAWPFVVMYLGKDTRETESGVKLIGEYISKTMQIKE